MGLIDATVRETWEAEEEKLTFVATASRLVAQSRAATAAADGKGVLLLPDDGADADDVAALADRLAFDADAVVLAPADLAASPPRSGIYSWGLC